MTFGERFEAKCSSARHPVSVGLDPRLDEIPSVVRDHALAASSSGEDAVRHAISRFHELVISAVSDLVPAVKLQLAFYEQYGIAGLLAFRDTIAAAKRADLLVIADGKRNDIPSTAAAYARAFLGQTRVFGESTAAFDVDAMTVNPYLGWDSLVPFAEAARDHEKGLFVLTHTSNPSSVDLQEAVAENEPIYLRVARLISALDEQFFSGGRFSSAGAIVGCTFPAAAAEIRRALPRAPIVVVGYGAQEGVLAGCSACFTGRNDGAIVNASRSLTYGHDEPVSEDELAEAIRAKVEQMGEDLANGLPRRELESPG